MRGREGGRAGIETPPTSEYDCYNATPHDAFHGVFPAIRGHHNDEQRMSSDQGKVATQFRRELREKCDGIRPNQRPN